jgi:hypothetical protein
MSFASRCYRMFLPAAALLLMGSTTIPEAEFAITQGSNTFALNDARSTIMLRKKEFSAWFRQRPYNEEKNEFYSTQIALSLDKNDLDKIREGISTSGIDYFSPGTGVAANGNKTPAFITTKENAGHNYIVYENNGEHRAKLKRTVNDMLVLQYPMSTFFKDSKQVKISKLDASELYMVIFSDRNLNKIVEKGEYRLVTIKLT